METELVMPVWTNSTPNQILCFAAIGFVFGLQRTFCSCHTLFWGCAIDSKTISPMHRQHFVLPLVWKNWACPPAHSDHIYCVSPYSIYWEENIKKLYSLYSIPGSIMFSDVKMDRVLESKIRKGSSNFGRFYRSRWNRHNVLLTLFVCYVLVLYPAQNRVRNS